MFMIAGVMLPILIIETSLCLFISFIILWIIIVLFLWKCVIEKIDIYNLFVAIYYMIFLYFAPIMQIYYNIFPNRVALKEEYAVYNILLSAAFLLSYGFLFPRFHYRLSFMDKLSYKISAFSRRVGSIVFFIIVSLIIVCFFRRYLISPAGIVMFFNEQSYITESFLGGKAIYLFVWKFLFFIGSVPLYIMLAGELKLSRVASLFLAILSFGIIILLKNPFNEKRALVGSLYLSLVLFYILYKRKFVLTKELLVILLYTITFLLILLYPAAKTLTHVSTNFNYLVADNHIFQEMFRKYIFSFRENITSLDFDSWVNAQVTIEYTTLFGHGWGKQTLTSLLFFIPRNIFPCKGEGTGGIVGDFIIQNYGGWQKQISNPLYSEFYYDLGIIGILSAAVFLDFIRRVSARLKSSNSQYLYATSLFVDFYTLYLLRGDFISCYAYLVGYLTAVVGLPYFFITLINWVHNRVYK